MKNNITKKIFLLSIIVFFTLFICNRLFFFKKGFLENFASHISYPVLFVSHKISRPIKNFFTQRKNYKTLQEKYQQLQDQNEELLLENIKLKSLIHYDKLSKKLLQFQERYKLDEGIFSKIIAQNFSDDQHFFLINKGYKDGVKENMAAIYKFQLLGRVTEVYKHYSKILLITDRSCKVASFTSTSNAAGIVQGRNQKNRCEVVYVSHLSKVEKEDLVISSGQGLVFPEGFCLGKVINYVTKDLCYNIELETLVDFSNLNFCLLVSREQIISF